MYGKKDAKRKRLESIAVAVAQAPGGVTQAGLARALGVSPSTVLRDLAALEQAVEVEPSPGMDLLRVHQIGGSASPTPILTPPIRAKLPCCAIFPARLGRRSHDSGAEVRLPLKG